MITQSNRIHVITCRRNYASASKTSRALSGVESSEMPYSPVTQHMVATTLRPRPASYCSHLRLPSKTLFGSAGVVVHSFIRPLFDSLSTRSPVALMSRPFSRTTPLAPFASSLSTTNSVNHLSNQYFNKISAEKS